MVFEDVILLAVRNVSFRVVLNQYDHKNITVQYELFDNNDKFIQTPIKISASAFASNV